MPIVEWSKPIISQECIAACISKLDEISTADPILRIIASEVVTEVDILLIAYFLLFKRNAVTRNLQIVLELQKNIKPFLRPGINDRAKYDELEALKLRYFKETGAEADDTLGRTLRHYMAHANLQGTRQPFILQYGYHFDFKYETGYIDDISIASNFKRNWYVISDKFIPVLFVNTNSWGMYFTTAADDMGLKKTIAFNKTNSILSTAVYREITRRIAAEGQKVAAIKLLGRLAFYQSLARARLLNFYLMPENEQISSYRSGGLTGKAAHNYYLQLKDVFDELSQKPLIFQFVFATLIASDLLPPRVEADNSAQFINIIKNLWGFVQELIKGIHELALNSLEHTVKKNGVISARVYREGRYADLNPDITAIFREYLTSLDGHTSSFLDFNVIDSGEIGVLKTLIDELKTQDDNKPDNSLKNDLQLLTSGEVTLRNFLDSSEPLRLNQQAKRATAHLGLLALSRLVENNKGLILASTWETNKESTKRLDQLVYPGDKTFSYPGVPYGTNFHIVLPVRKEQSYLPRVNTQESPVPEATPEYINGFERLSNFAMTAEGATPDPEATQRQIIKIRLQTPLPKGISTEYWESFPFRNQESIKSITDKKLLICLDLTDVNVDQSKLFRFLGNWELKFAGTPLILLNLKTTDYLGLLWLNKIYITSLGIPFWNEQSLVIIYSYIQHVQEERRFYYTDVLWGNDEESFVAINKLIRKNNFNALITDLESIDSAFTKNKEKAEIILNNKSGLKRYSKLNNSGLFYNSGTLLPLHLLISDRAGYSLYELTALYILQNDIGLNNNHDTNAYENVSSYCNTIPGYKITDSHFRIGTKLHIANFYYAKRFFQSSFFASPLAFLVSQRIAKELLPPNVTIEQLEQIKGGITIVGYGQYSELLLSLVEQFLVMALKNKQTGYPENHDARRIILRINHDLVSDNEELIFIRNEIIHRMIIPIVPISTTFSTSFKLIEAVGRKTSNQINIGPFINVIYVYNSISEVIREKMVEKQFGIARQDFKTRKVTIDTFTGRTKELVNANTIEQSFFLPLKAEWQPVADCKMCFPDSPELETPLFTTDKDVVTPAVIFGYPIGKRTKKSGKLSPVILDENSIKYGHFKEEAAHHLFFIEVDSFFKINYDRILEWLPTVRKSDFITGLEKEHKHVVLISPNHYSNAPFLNLINEQLFSNSATLIHYDVHQDDIQNFQLFYRSEINNPANTIIFVDDVLTSGDTFIRTNFFLKLTRTKTTGFDAAIVLVDRSSHYAGLNITRKLPEGETTYFTYASLNMPAIRPSKLDCPICMEHKRYLELAKNSFLDKLKYHFLEQAMKIRAIRFDKILTHSTLQKVIPTPENYKNLTLKQIGAKDNLKYVRRADGIDRLYQWFSTPGNPGRFENMIDFDGWVNSLIKETALPFEGSDLLKKSKKTSEDALAYKPGNTNDTILKVLTQNPFIQFKPLREKTFRWVLGYLQAEVRLLSIRLTGLATLPLDADTFRNLKFLIRRAGMLNQNYLISQKFLGLLKEFYGPNGIQGYLDRLAISKHQLGTVITEKNGKEGDLFELEENLKKYITDAEQFEKLLDFKIFFAAQVKELLYQSEARSIHLEESIMAYEGQENNPPLFAQLLRILREENGILIQYFWEFFKLRFPVDDEGIPGYDVSTLQKSFDESSLAQHYRYQTLSEFLKKAKLALPEKNNPLKNYLWLMYYMGIEQPLLKGTLNAKTETIIKKMMDIVFAGDEHRGAFLIVKYKKAKEDAYFIAYNDGTDNRLNKDSWLKPDCNYIAKFLNGELSPKGKPSISIVELRRDGKDWIDLFTTKPRKQKVELCAEILPKVYDQLLLLRLNCREIIKDKDSPIGMVNNDHPLAVIGFFGKSEPGNLLSDVRTHRLLLLLKDSLSQFIQRHHENDEFRDWIEADNFRKIALLTGHGREMLMKLAGKSFPATEGEKPYKQIVSAIHLIQYFMMDLERGMATSKHTVRLFKDYFSPSKIDESFFEDDVRKLAQEVFRFEEIENPVGAAINFIKTDPDGKVNILTAPPQVSLEFSKPILLMILFEVFVNAKKNRWLYFKEPYTSHLDFNKVHMELLQKNGTVYFTISNTGPFVDKKYISRLNDGDNPKSENEISGTYLINKVLHIFNIGKMRFSSEEIQDKLGWFRVELTLRNWNEEYITD